MGLDNVIISMLKDKLKNPIVEVLKEIKIQEILTKSNFVKREVGIKAYFVLLHFIYMIVMNKKISTFISQSNDSFSKDVYYRLLKNKNYNWKKLLFISTNRLIFKLSHLQKNLKIKVAILDDTVESKIGKKIEGVCDKLWSNKDKKLISGINMISLNYSDGFSNFMLDFTIKFNDKLKLSIKDFTNQFHHRSNAHKRRLEAYGSKLDIALDMIKRALLRGIDVDYLLIDSWYAKPIFINSVKDNGLDIVARIANNVRIWNFKGKHKTLDVIYNFAKKRKILKVGNYNKIKYKYFSFIAEHKLLGKVKIVFIKTDNNLIPIISTDLILNDEEIIDIYKKRWNIEQGYKELREYFEFGKEENRIYEALIARITLSFLTYNIVSYINRINHEPQTIGGLFKDLECELTNLAISMDIFIQILDEIAKIPDIVNRNKDLIDIILLLRTHTQNELGFMCES